MIKDISTLPDASDASRRVPTGAMRAQIPGNRFGSRSKTVPEPADPTGSTSSTLVAATEAYQGPIVSLLSQLKQKLGPVLLAAALLTAPAIGYALAQPTRAPELVPTGQPIPKGFKTWSLFLVCNPAWLGDDATSKTKMAALHSAFLGFGQSLGSRNAAVWFATSAGAPADYDGDRAGDFCGTYRLESNLSPFVVVTGDYPTTAGDPGDFISISLVGLDIDNINTLLGQLSDLIRTAQLDRAKMDTDRYWRGWAQVLEDWAGAAGKIAKGFSFTVDTRVIKVKFDPKEISQ